MEILVLGLNHKTAPIEIREKLSIPTHKATELLKTLEERRIFKERLLLSTCNRTEIYGVSDEADSSILRTKQLLSEYSNLALSELEDKWYVLKQPDSVEHLFSVASGLDSMVVGETEIIGQVKDAYHAAHENRQTGKVLNTLFQKSFKVAKDLRTQTDIGVGSVGVASVAAGLAGKIFEDLKGKNVMVIGTGEMSSQVAKAMVSRGARPLIVSSRHFDRATELAASLGGKAVPYEEYEKYVKETDVIIASTLAPKVLIRKEQVRRWMKARHEKPLFLIDIALPRNVEAEAGTLDDVYLYNIDDLKEITDKNRAERQSQVNECLRRVRHQSSHFMNWLIKEFASDGIPAR